MSLTPTTDRELIEVKENGLNTHVIVRMWGTEAADRPLLADARLSADDARRMAADLLHAARMLDGQQVSFKWHQASCSPVDRAGDTCKCKGSYASVQHEAIYWPQVAR
jgi:hypothetical protein